MSIDATNATYAADDPSKWKNGVNPMKVDTALNQLADSVKWTVTDIITSDYTASDHEIVRIDPS